MKVHINYVVEGTNKFKRAMLVHADMKNNNNNNRMVIFKKRQVKCFIKGF